MPCHTPMMLLEHTCGVSYTNKPIVINWGVRGVPYVFYVTCTFLHCIGKHIKRNTLFAILHCLCIVCTKLTLNIVVVKRTQFCTMDGVQCSHLDAFLYDARKTSL